MTTILSDAGTFDVQASDGLWLSFEDTERVTGWTPKPEGMCRDDACVPMPCETLRGGMVEVEAFWRKRGAPVLRSESGDVWVLGESAETRNQVLAGETAPDFTLPDLDGKPHSLSSLRGNRIFLATWASW